MPVLFFFNDTATTEIYTLSLHDALPICARGDRGPASRRRLDRRGHRRAATGWHGWGTAPVAAPGTPGDRKSTRLNSSHSQISYAVFCLKKKKNPQHALYVVQSALDHTPQ